MADRLGLLVRVQDRFLKTVVFVGKETDRGFMPVGTGFIGVSRYREHNFSWVVTADHVVDSISGDEIAIRMNKKSGDASTLKLPKEDGMFDDRNDIAIFSLPPVHDIYDFNHLSIDRASRQAGRGIWEAGLGDEVATIGLYTSHHGYTKNIPVVRTGNIAMLPDEPVRGTRGETVAYLIETRSIVGLSGSPVFVHFPQLHVEDDGTARMLTGAGPRAFPIGMMVGYHLVQSAADQIAVPQFPGDDAGPGLNMDERNTGFAVVVPFERIIDMVEDEVVRAKMDAAIVAQSAAPTRS